ncbi:MAG: diguanylate cyclase [Lachnospiraceae bacterium]|nr:diguanylate cyclase [Lachnospiraceae bacterium]
MFFLDPIDVLFAVSYFDCWMDDSNIKQRNAFRWIFRAASIVNGVVVLIDMIFGLDMFFYFENAVYYRGVMYIPRALAIAVLIILIAVYAAAFRNNIMSEYKNIVMVLPSLAIVGAILQVVFGIINATYAGITIACLILYFSFQSNDANMDYMTGVRNRRGLDFKLQNRIKSSNMGGKSFSAIMIDIDYFKVINDELGHDEGDKAIKTMADILVDVFGATSEIGRYGGDEFCVVSEITDADAIERNIGIVREKLAKAKQKRKWPDAVGVSCGYEVYVKNSGVSVEEFSEHIDKLMYDEKESHHAKVLGEE